MNTDHILTIRNLCKNYPGVEALKAVDLDIERNAVHCIVGENGAGKSTFIKILTAAEKRTKGEIVLNGLPYNPKTVKDAMNLGISTLFQELNIVEQMTVERNLLLGRENTFLGVIRKTNRTNVLDLFREFAPDISIKRLVSELSFAEKQVVEIIKAIGVEASVLIMDEPTASLSVHESQRLFKLIETLKSEGMTIIYISHILDEIFAIGDYVTVFRDGNVIGTKRVREITQPELIKMMVGKIVIEKYKPRHIDYGKEVLKVSGLCTAKLRNISFGVCKNEIVGFYGLRGAGKSELAQALYGIDVVHSGRILIDDTECVFKMPKHSLKRGIAMVPEERLTEGLIVKHTIRSNISLANLKKISFYGIVNRQKEKSTADRYVNLMNIKARSIEQVAGTLSGGNQQKVVISKYLNSESVILLMDEPTRGIDIGAKEEIHNIIRGLAEQGATILVFSSELPEIMNLCDRIILLKEGEIIREFRNEEANAEEIIQIATQGKKELQYETHHQ